MIITASIYIGNMSREKQAALLELTAEDLKSLTHFDAQMATRDDCLATWSITVDETSPTFEGGAFAREDFVTAVLDAIEAVA